MRKTRGVRMMAWQAPRLALAAESSLAPSQQGVQFHALRHGGDLAFASSGGTLDLQGIADIFSTEMGYRQDWKPRRHGTWAVRR
jgi:hypothetical protein